MIIETTRMMFEKFRARFLELYPNTPITLISCDKNLEILGFCEDVPCVFKLDLTEDNLLCILDDLMQIEIDAFNTDDGKCPSDDDPLYQKYVKYGWMYDLLFGALEKGNG